MSMSSLSYLLILCSDGSKYFCLLIWQKLTCYLLRRTDKRDCLIWIMSFSAFWGDNVGPFSAKCTYISKSGRLGVIEWHFLLQSMWVAWSSCLWASVPADLVKQNLRPNSELTEIRYKLTKFSMWVETVERRGAKILKAKILKKSFGNLLLPIFSFLLPLLTLDRCGSFIAVCCQKFPC